jgi:hypothetical protein
MIEPRVVAIMAKILLITAAREKKYPGKARQADF